MMSIIQELIHYISRPYLFKNKEKWSREVIFTLGRLLAIKLVLVVTVYVITTFALDVFGIEKPDRKQSVFEQLTIGRILLLVLLAPFIEELFFRSWLRNKWAVLYFLPVFFLLSLFLLSQTFLFEINSSILKILAVFTIIYIALIYRTRSKFRNDDKFVKSIFPFAFWGSITIFALMHIGNYASSQMGFFAFLLVMPQFISGIFYAYVCGRFGFFAAFGCHAFWNSSLIFTALTLKSIM